MFSTYADHSSFAKADSSKAIRTTWHPSGTRRVQVRDKNGMTVGVAPRSTFLVNADTGHRRVVATHTLAAIEAQQEAPSLVCASVQRGLSAIRPVGLGVDTEGLVWSDGRNNLFI